MDNKTLIEKAAEKFSKDLERYSSGYRDEEEFKSDLYIELINYYDDNDKLIYLYKVIEGIEIGLNKHMKICHKKEEPEKCTINTFYYKCKYFTEQEIKAISPSIGLSILRPSLNQDLLDSNIIQLKDFPEAARLFQSAITKLNEFKYERNLLDDLRLSLESLLKAVLQNAKSLENQKEPLGAFLKQRGTSKELCNMYCTIIDYYAKYQNTFVKHNDNIIQDELELMVNLTSSFIQFLIYKK